MAQHKPKKGDRLKAKIFVNGPAIVTIPVEVERPGKEGRFYVRSLAAHRPFQGEVGFGDRAPCLVEPEPEPEEPKEDPKGKQDGKGQGQGQQGSEPPKEDPKGKDGDK